MDTIPYKTYYELNLMEMIFHYKSAFIVMIIFLLVGLFVIINSFKNKKAEKANRISNFIFGCFILLIPIFFSLYIGSIIQGNYINLQRIYTTKSYKIVEGLIENFHPMPKSGHDKESFSVKGVLFEYSDYEISGFFNNTASHGGPFKTNGQQVKITYFPTKRGNAIIKVELKDETD